jgi:CheY-like chemotaxis protein
MITADSHRKVLFVDDDKGFLETMRRLMGALSHGNWEVFTAETTAQAFAALQDICPQLVVIDVQMPVMDGLQLLTLLNRRHPNLPKVILTGYPATEAYRAACLGKGAELFLEKPKTSAGHESLFATLNELIKWQPEEGFRGVLRRVGLQDVLQMECLSRNSSVLEVKTPGSYGHIFIREGQIVHALLGALKGEPAFNQMLAFRGGEFVLKPFTEPTEQTLEGSWEFLLMEAARVRDEMGETLAGVATATADEGPPRADPGIIAGLSDSALPGPLGTESQPEDMAPTAERASEVASAPGDTAAVVSVSAPGEAPEPTMTQLAPSAAEAPPRRRRIEEVLICSAQGDVLYEWQCRNSDLWINFFEFLSQKSRRLAQGLVLGEFDRIEVCGTGTRLVALVTPQRGVLVRARQELTPPSAEAAG